MASEQNYLVLFGTLNGGFSVTGVVHSEDDIPPEADFIPLETNLQGLPYANDGDQFLFVGNIIDGITAYGPLSVEDVSDLDDLQCLRGEDWVLV